MIINGAKLDVIGVNARMVSKKNPWIKNGAKRAKYKNI